MPEIPVKEEELVSFEDPKANTEDIIINQDYGETQKTIEDNVKRILEENPLACKNDFILCLEYWKITGQIKLYKRKKDIIIKIDENRITEITQPESISRARRKLHQEGKIVYDQETEKTRKDRQQEVKEYFYNVKSDNSYGEQIAQLP